MLIAYRAALILFILVSPASAQQPIIRNSDLIPALSNPENYHSVPQELIEDIEVSISNGGTGMPPNQSIDKTIADFDSWIFVEGNQTNPANAVNFYVQESAKGNPEASLRAALAFDLGIGTSANPETAFDYYSVAMQQGSPIASTAVGKALLFGNGVQQDLQAAIPFLEAGSEGGSSEAKIILAEAYQFGIGVDRDLESSSIYWQDYLEEENTSPKELLNYALSQSGTFRYDRIREEYRPEVEAAARMNEPAAVAAAFYLAHRADDFASQRLWVARSEALSATGDVESSNFLGDLYVRGIHMDFDATRAAEYFRVSASRGNVYGTTRLGMIALVDPTIDLGLSAAEGLELVKQGAVAGDPSAYLTLAALSLEQGSLEEAFDYASTAEELGGAESRIIASEFKSRICNEGSKDLCAPVSVFFATDRKFIEDSGSYIFLDGEQNDGEVTFGRADVTIFVDDARNPSDRPRMMNNIEWLAKQAHPLIKLILSSQEPKVSANEVTAVPFGNDIEALLDQVELVLTETGSEKVLIFTHGFSNGFETAAQRLAIWSESSKYKAIPVLFSWPSLNVPIIEIIEAGRRGRLGYLSDRSMIEKSCANFSILLENFARRFGEEKVVVVAHSMGARLTEMALMGCPRSENFWPADLVVGDLIYAAPDIEKRAFSLLVERYGQMVSSLTVYVSANDVALQTAQTIDGGSRRLGQGGAERPISPDYFTVDASAIENLRGADDQNHSYVFSLPQAKYDILELIAGNTDPDTRNCPAKQQLNDLVFWTLQPSCLE